MKKLCRRIVVVMLVVSMLFTGTPELMLPKNVMPVVANHAEASVLHENESSGPSIPMRSFTTLQRENADAVACAFAQVAGSDQTVGEFAYCLLADDTAVITAYKGNADNVQIPFVLGNADVVGIADGAFSERVSILTIHGNVLYIGDQAIAASTTILSWQGSYAATWAQQHHYTLQSKTAGILFDNIVDLSDVVGRVAVLSDSMISLPKTESRRLTVGDSFLLSKEGAEEEPFYQVTAKRAVGSRVYLTVKRMKAVDGFSSRVYAGEKNITKVFEDSYETGINLESSDITAQSVLVASLPDDVQQTGYGLSIDIDKDIFSKLSKILSKVELKIKTTVTKSVSYSVTIENHEVTEGSMIEDSETNTEISLSFIKKDNSKMTFDGKVLGNLTEAETKKVLAKLLAKKKKQQEKDLGSLFFVIEPNTGFMIEIKPYFTGSVSGTGTVVLHERTLTPYTWNTDHQGWCKGEAILSEKPRPTIKGAVCGKISIGVEVQLHFAYATTVLKYKYAFEAKVTVGIPGNSGPCFTFSVEVGLFSEIETGLWISLGIIELQLASMAKKRTDIFSATVGPLHWSSDQGFHMARNCSVTPAQYSLRFVTGTEWTPDSICYLKEGTYFYSPVQIEFFSTEGSVSGSVYNIEGTSALKTINFDYNLHTHDALEYKICLPQDEDSSEYCVWKVIEPNLIGDYPWDDQKTVRENLETVMAKQITSQEDLPDIVTLQAQWKDKYAIVFDANGGTFPEGSNAVGNTVTKYFAPNSLGKAPNYEPTMTKARFTGWALDPAGAELWDAGLPVTENMRVYALYQSYDPAKPNTLNAQYGANPTLIGSIEPRNAGVVNWDMGFENLTSVSIDLANQILAEGIEAFLQTADGFACQATYGDFVYHGDNLINCKGYVLANSDVLTSVVLTGLVNPDIEYTSFTIPSTFNGVPVIAEAGFLQSLKAEEVIFAGDPHMIYGFAEPDAHLFDGNTYIKRIYMDSATMISSIANYSFYNCVNLEGVALPGTVQKIGQSAFAGCPKLQKVVFGNQVEELGSHAFGDCNGLTEVSINTPYLKTMQQAFADTDGRPAHIDLSIGHDVYILPANAFSGCSSLRSVSVVSDSNLRLIGDSAFYSCTGLTNIILNEGLKTISSKAFSGDSALTELEIPRSVTSFYTPATGDLLTMSPVYGTSIEKLTIGGEITQITKYMLRPLALTLKEIKIRQGVTSIDEQAFSSATFSKLERVELPDSLETIGASAFSGASKLVAVYAGSQLAAINSQAFTNTSPVFYRLPGTPINAWLAQWCLDNGFIYATDGFPLVTVTFDYAMDTIQVVEQTKPAFSSLESPETPQRTGYEFVGWFAPNSVKPWDFANDILGMGNLKLVAKWMKIAVNGLYTVEDGEAVLLSYAMSDVENSLVKLPTTYQGYPVTRIADGAFAGEPVTYLMLPAHIQGLTPATFAGADLLSWISVPEDSENYSESNGILYNKDKTELVFCPAGNKINTFAMPDSVITVCAGAFSNHTELTSITWGMSLQEIQPYAFYGCNGLRNVTLPESIIAIGDGAFQNCSNLSFAAGAQNCSRIGANAFQGTGSCIFYGEPESALVLYATNNSRLKNLYTVTYLLNNQQIGQRKVERGKELPMLNAEAANGEVVLQSWYIDEELTEAVDFATALMPANDLNLYTASIPMYDVEEFTYVVEDDETALTGICIVGYHGISTEIFIPETINNQTVLAIDASAFSVGSAIHIPKTLRYLDGVDYARTNLILYVPDGTIAENTITALGLTASAAVHTLSFETDGGRRLQPLHVQKGTTVTLPDAIRDNSVLTGWNINSVSGDYAGACGDSFCMPDEDVVLYATWDGQKTEYDFLWEEQGEAITVTGSLHKDAVTIPAFINGLPVKSIASYVFMNDSMLTFLSLPDGLTSIGSFAFYHTGLAGLTLPETVESVGEYAFAMCSHLQVFGWSPSARDFNRGMLCEDQALSVLTLPEGIESIGAFSMENCISLTSLTLPNTVVTIGQKAFTGMSGLKTLVIGSGVDSLHTTALDGCTALQDINVRTGNSHYISNAGVLYYSDLAGLVRYPAGRTDSTFTVPSATMLIEAHAFADTVWLNEIVLPQSMVQFGAGAFQNSSLIQMDLSHCLELTSMPERAFSDCSHLQSLSLPPQLVSIGNEAFLGCELLTEIDIPDSVASLGSHVVGSDTILIVSSGSETEQYAISNGLAYRLRDWEAIPVQSIQLAKESLILQSGISYTLNVQFTPANTTDAISWISGDNSILRVDQGYIRPLKAGETEIFIIAGNLMATVPVSVTEHAVRIMQDSACLISGSTLQLTAESIADNVPGITNIGWTCDNASVSADGTLTVSETAIATVSLLDERGIADIRSFACIAPNDAVSLPSAVHVVEEEAFRGLSTIHGVIIPDGVTELGDYAFADCDQLKVVLIYADAVTIHESVFENSDSVTIVCHEGSTAAEYAQSQQLNLLIIH